MLNLCIIPESWRSGPITPLYKNNEPQYDPIDYIGITLLICMGKGFFTSFLNHTLDKYLDDIIEIVDEQAGFRQNHSSLNHISALHANAELHVKSILPKTM